MRTLIFILFIVCSIPLFSQDYVVTTAKNVNIRSKADMNSFIISRAEKGDKRAMNEAEEIIHRANNPIGHQNFYSIRRDENILYIFHHYGIQPALYDEIMK